MARIVPAQPASPPPSFEVARIHCGHKVILTFNKNIFRYNCSSMCCPLSILLLFVAARENDRLWKSTFGCKGKTISPREKKLKNRLRFFLLP